MLLNKDKVSKSRNSEILFSLKIPSYEKLAMASEFDLTWFIQKIFFSLIP